MINWLAGRAGIFLVIVASLPWAEAPAQTALRVTGQAVPLIRDADRSFQHPRWSPDGSRIAFTSDAYQGIWVADAEGRSVAQLSDERAAGFGYSWSPDGTAIVARVARYDGPRRSDALKLFRIHEREERFLTEFRPDMPSLPVWSRDGAHVVLARRTGVEVLSAEPVSGKSVSSDPVLVVRGDRLAVARPGEEVVASVNSIPSGHPINLATSPDGRQAAFEIVGGNLFVASADGGPVADLGRGHRPQWSPDGNWVVYMKTNDDGHVITSSDLYAARADGSVTVQLTDTPEALEMNPSWSPDGSRIAFDDRGTLYQIQVSYER